MATSKSDPKPPQVMDVSYPGKSAPSSSAKPIIVSNRPILKQDPMVVTPEDTDQPGPPSAPPVARTKSITVIRPLSEAERTAITLTPTAPVPAASTPAPTPPTRNPGASPHSVKIDDEPDIGLDAAPDKTVATVDIDKEVLGGDSLPPQPVDQPAPKPAEPVTTPVAPSVLPAAPEPAKDAVAAPKSAAAPTLATPAAPAAPAPEAAPETAETTTSDDQLAPNQALDAAKQKEEEAKAALLAKQEEIIASRQFYLPIQNVAAKRGALRSLLILVVVIILAAVWFDAVLDAGIVHIGGVQAPTDFFK